MILQNDQLALLMTGNTLYLDIGQETDAVIYYGVANDAYMRMPGKDALMSGSWRLGTAGYSVEWRDGPKAEWAVEHEAGRFTYLDIERTPRGTVSKIVPGDAENLATS